METDMKRHLLIIVLSLAAALLLAGALGAQANQDNENFTLRVGGPVIVKAGENLGAVWVIGNAATIDGTVHELVVINGSARVTGTVTGNLVLMKGTAELGPSAVVGKDVLLYRSTLNSSPGARVTGTVHNEAGFSFGAQALWFFWLSVTIGMIGAGILVAYFAGERLQVVADSLGSNWSGTVLAALAIVIGLPMAAILSFMTGVGFVFGLFLMFVMIPMIALAGYVVAGASIGRIILGTRKESPSSMYGAVVIGILAMQAAAVIPGIGVLAVLIASQLGAGALMYRRWKKHREVLVPSRLIIEPA
jgi:hypothetical protein